MAFSKKDKIQLSIIAVVVILGTLRLWSVMHRTTTSPAVPAFQPQVPTISTSPLVETITDANAISQVSGETSNRRLTQISRARQRWGRDPFFGLLIQEGLSDQPNLNEKAGELTLTGISLKGSRAMAIVNRTVVHEGDEVFGMKVLAIERDRVIFASDSQELVLRFGGAR